MGVNEICRNARKASFILANISEKEKNDFLLLLAEKISEKRKEWLSANEEDLINAKENGLSLAMMDRLALNDKRVDDIVSSIREVVELPDPTGKILEEKTRPNGIRIVKVSVPLGVVGMIYEARPNVTVDAAVLCFKSGNVCVLRGGKEAIASNKAVVKIMRETLKEAGLPENCISLIEDVSHDSTNELMHCKEYVDVLIPRGGKGLIRAVKENSSVPVIITGEGVCHIYVDEDADLKMAARILYNAKCQRPSVCNAVECVVIHQNILKDFLDIAVPLLEEKNVELRADEKALAYLDEKAVMPSQDDYDTEYNDYILAIKTVSDLKEAIDFINAHSTRHSEAIMTSDLSKAERFMNYVDAAAVYVNASTRFTDGGEFGLGCEIGISTQKLHARGPMGLKELTGYKYKIYGNGQIRK